MKALRELYLDHNQIDDEAARTLLASAVAGQLSKLSLSHNDISSAVLADLQMLATSSRLKVLDLKMNDIDMPGKELLAGSFGSRLRI